MKKNVVGHITVTSGDVELPVCSTSVSEFENVAIRDSDISMQHLTATAGPAEIERNLFQANLRLRGDRPAQPGNTDNVEDLETAAD